MTTLVSWTLWNALLAAGLALVASTVTRCWRNPHVAHAFWLIVLLKLVTPPLVPAPLGFNFVSRSLAVVNDVWSDEGQGAESAGPWLGDEAAEGSGRQNAGHAAAEPALHALLWRGLQRNGLSVLCALWLVGTVVYGILAVRKHRRLYPVLAASQPADAQLEQTARQIAAALGLRRCPSICLTSAPVCPFAVSGIPGAKVVLPTPLLSTLSQEQVTTILAHEIAHIRRGDPWIHLANVMVLALHWWNPVAWWATFQLQRAEEECADAWVVWLLPTRRRDYGRTLLQTVDYMMNERANPTMLGTGLGGSMLKRRINMIVNQAVSPRGSRWAMALILAIAVIVLPLGAPQAVADRTGPGEQEKAAASAQTTTKGAEKRSQKKAAAPAKDEADEKDLLGKWEVVYAKWYGKEIKNKNQIIFEFRAGNKVIERHIAPQDDPAGRPFLEQEGTYKLDTSVTPWQIDVEMFEDRPDVGGGGPRKGIISIKQDVLLFCILGTNAAPRPQKMVSETGTYHILRRMRRVATQSGTPLRGVQARK